MNLRLSQIFFFVLLVQALLGHIQSYPTPLVKYLKPIEEDVTPAHMDMVDSIYVINLDERKEKWQRMEKLFGERGLAINRFSAINGWQLTNEQHRELAGPYPVRLRGGAVGCLLSHISVVKEAFERGFEAIWICEDDIEFVKDPHEISISDTKNDLTDY